MKCSKCGSKMGTRTGKFGDFYFCENSSPKDPHKTVSVTLRKEPAIHVRKFNPYDNVSLDDKIMNDVYSFGFKNDHIGNLAQSSLGAPSDLCRDVDNWGYPEP